MYKKTLAIIILLVCSLLASPSAHAQAPQGIDITVSPSLLDYTAKPGDTIQGKFRIRNNFGQALPLTISLKKLNATATSENPSPIDPPIHDEFPTWVTFDNSSIVAPSREWMDVTFTIKIPPTAGFGYYYAFEIKPKANAITTKNIALNGEVLIIMLLNVKKEGAKTEAKLVEFKPATYINEYLPVSFLAKVANTGNIHLKPRGNIFIQSSGEKSIGILEVNPSLGAILPGTSRTYATDWNDGFLVQEAVVQDGKPQVDKNGAPITKLTINWNKLTDFRIGKYTANILLVYDNGSRDVTLEGQTSFWVIPYRFLGGIVASILILFFIIRFILRWYIRKELRKHQD